MARCESPGGIWNGGRTRLNFSPACAGTTPPPAQPCAAPSVHPRVRGDDSSRQSRHGPLFGSPPRARGRRLAHGAAVAGARFTPACAGTTRSRAGCWSATTVHPRVRGDDLSSSSISAISVGSPPRARGRPRRHGRPGRVLRFTPACAGTTPASLRLRLRPAVHPRVRGDDSNQKRGVASSLGSPPRARGRRLERAGRAALVRFTPACAGTTPQAPAWRCGSSVHPRVRGDDTMPTTRPSSSSGSPPRARGRPCRRASSRSARRFTPACAGTTCGQPARESRRAVHPRVRGDDARRSMARGIVVGSPPRARGRLGLEVAGNALPRFTPACAGTTTRTTNRWTP